MSRRPFTTKVVTANHLLEGDVIWLTADDHWTRRIEEAELIKDEAHGQIRLLFLIAIGLLLLAGVLEVWVTPLIF